MRLGFGIGVTDVRRPSEANPQVPATPVISIATGGGYKDSVYASSHAGQWTADGVNIAGAVGTTYQMTRANEGKAIRCGASNTIEMWVINDIPTSYRTNGGWWDPKIAQNTSAGTVTAWPDLWAVRDMSQTTLAQRPSAVTLGGYPAAAWPNDTSVNTYLGPATNFAPAFWLLVMQYKTGLETAFDGYDAILSDSGNVYRVMGNSGSDQLYAGTWAGTASKNGSASAATVLPLAKSLLSMSGTPQSAQWSLGRSRTSGDRAWKGAMFEVLALGVTPTEALKQQIEGCVAHRNGIATSLPAQHPYRVAGPRLS